MDARTACQYLYKNTKKLKKRYRIVITPGEPAGIGADLIVYLAQYDWPVELVVCADANLLQDRAKLLGLPLTIFPYDIKQCPIPQQAGTIMLLSVDLQSPVVPGELNTKNSNYVIKTLIRACDGCLNKEFSGLVTGPVHKGVINESGFFFNGHTDFFEKRSHSKKTVMMLVSDTMRVALVTHHIAIKRISDIITKQYLRNTITIVHHDLSVKFGILKPHILVCGLNPHAGENGYIGTEEIDIIKPVILEMRAKGINITGPLPADTIFQLKYLNTADVILAMYHDQGLPVLKYHRFNHSVNITLGLPFIRTSVDHGTALDLAGTGKINVSSFLAALNLAIEIIARTHE